MKREARRKKKSKFGSKVAANSRKQKDQGSQYGYLSLPKGVSVFKETPKSRVRLDFLPYRVTDPQHPDRDDELEIAMPGDLWYKRPYKLHRNIGVDNNSYVCPTSVGKRCPICEYRAKLLREGANWQDEAVRALKPSDRNLYIVVPKGHKDYDEKPHIWDISQYLFQNKLNDELEENEDYGVFPDLEEGLTLRIRFSEEQFGKNTFADTSRIDFEERDEPYDESILDEVPNLDEVLTVLSYKQLEAKFLEMEDVEAGEDDVVDEDVGDTEEEAADDGRPEEDMEEDELEQEEDRSRENKHGKKKTKPSPKQQRCPYDHKFGEDNDMFDECEDCELYDECLDAQDTIPF